MYTTIKCHISLWKQIFRVSAILAAFVSSYRSCHKAPIIQAKTKNINYWLSNFQTCNMRNSFSELVRGSDILRWGEEGPWKYRRRSLVPPGRLGCLWGQIPRRNLVPPQLGEDGRWVATRSPIPLRSMLETLRPCPFFWVSQFSLIRSRRLLESRD